MKNKLFWLMTVLSLAATAVSLRFLPDSIPMHYDIQGNVDRFGSKYELFIFPGVMALLGVIAAVLAGVYNKKAAASATEKELAEAKVNGRVLSVTMTVVGLVLLAVQAGSMASAFGYSGGTAARMPDWFSSVVCGAIGLLLVILGNIMPKAKRNTFLGVRTRWSMKNDRTWQASNRFGGVASVLCGLVIIAVSAVFRGMIPVFVTAAAVLVEAIATIVYSRMAFKKYGQEA